VVVPEDAPARAHVLYVAWGFAPAKSGGVLRVVETANLLVEAGWDVTVLACDVDDLQRYAGVDSTTLDLVDPRVEVVRVPFELGLVESDIRRFTEERVMDPVAWTQDFESRQDGAFPEPVYGLWGAPLEEAAERVHSAKQVDLVLATGGPFVDFSVGLHMRTAHDIPYVLDYRDAWSLNQFTNERRFDVEHPVAKAEASLLDSAAEVWFVNRAMLEWYETTYPQCAEKTRVVTNGYDASVLNGLERFSRGSGRLVFGFLGTLVAALAVEECLSGFRLARSQSPLVEASEFRFYGYLGHYPKPNGPLHELLREASDIGVEWHGPVEKTQIADVYNVVDVLVLALGASRYLTTGKVFEYMATGRPILSIHHLDNAVRDLLEGYPLWIQCSSLEPADIAAAFVRAAEVAESDPLELEAKSSRAQEYALKFDRRARLRPAIEGLPALVGRHGRLLDAASVANAPKPFRVVAFEEPSPTTRTVRMLGTLRRAGATVAAVSAPKFAPRVLALGYESIETPLPERSIWSQVVLRSRALAKDQSGASDSQVRVLEEVVALPGPVIRHKWSDMFVLAPQWVEGALAAAKDQQATIYWAADLNALPPAVWAKRATPGSKVVFDAHELFTDLDYLPPHQVALWEDLSQEFIPETDLLLTVGAQLATIFSERYAAPRVEVIESRAVSGFDVGPTVRTSIDLPDDVPLVIHIGNVSANRRPEMAVDLLSATDDVHCAFVGDVNAELKASLVDLAEERGVGKRLHLVGSVDGNQLGHFVSDADVAAMFYSPEDSDNLRFAMPNKLFDALGAGVPGVAPAETEAGALLEREGLGLTFDWNDADSLARAVRQVLDDSSYRSRARSRRSEFLWPAGEDRLIELVAELVETTGDER
jgi:glycosyltransferase involved in cell wall biosynthesis